MAHPILLDAPAVVARQEGLVNVTICGSFRRDPDGLRAAHRAFVATGAVVLSPVDPDFVREDEGFVYAAHEVGDDPVEIEARHLQAMQSADLVWLHAPGGYVGRSAAMELGFANALGLPVYGASLPEDPVLATFVRIIARPEDAVATRTPLQAGKDAPTRSLAALQHYYRRAARQRGWADETPQQSLLLLTEELGELARALRKTENGTIEAPGEDPVLELADVALYVIHLANVLDFDLASAVSAKEAINAERFLADADPLAA